MFRSPPEAGCSGGLNPPPPDARGGFTRLNSVLVAKKLDLCRAKIDGLYRELGASDARMSSERMRKIVPPGERFSPTASSVTVLSALCLAELKTLAASLPEAFQKWIGLHLAGPAVCDLDEAWIRRQYAPGNYPRWHAPHGWHQDGALAFDFNSNQPNGGPVETILPMVTGWIALNPCGMDSPGLELVTARLERLLRPPELIDESVRARFSPSEFWRPVLEAGDALLFTGDILHRTNVAPVMTQDRTSLELRFFSAEHIPERLKHHRFARLFD